MNNKNDKSDVEKYIQCFRSDVALFAEVVSSTPFVEFIKKYRLLSIGYDYCIKARREGRVYTFIDNGDGTELIKVYNFIPITIGLVRKMKKIFRVEKRKSGDYVINSDLNFETPAWATKFDPIVLPGEEEEYRGVEADELYLKYKKEAIRRSWENNRNFPFFDISGDDSSGNPGFW